MKSRIFVKRTSCKKNDFYIMASNYKYLKKDCLIYCEWLFDIIAKFSFLKFEYRLFIEEISIIFQIYLEVYFNLPFLKHISDFKFKVILKLSIQYFNNDFVHIVAALLSIGMK